VDEKRSGCLLDIQFILNMGQKIILKGVGIKVFDALRQMKEGSFDKKFIWGHEAGVAVADISGWIIISQYDE
jgi:hypothetical protein